MPRVTIYSRSIVSIDPTYLWNENHHLLLIRRIVCTNNANSLFLLYHYCCRCTYVQYIMVVVMRIVSAYHVSQYKLLVTPN